MNPEEEIFRQRFLPLYPRLFAAASALLGNGDDAADAVQDSMVKIWNHAEELASVERPEAYAMRALRATCVDMLRRRKLRQSELPAIDPAAPDEAEPDTAEFLQRAITTLPSAQQETIRLNVFAGLSADEIAEATEQTPANVRQQLCRGRRKLRELYQKYM